MSRGAAGPGIVWYTTGHGYGHATRSATVLRELMRLAPGARVAVRTLAPAALFDDLPGNRLRIFPASLDFGTIDTPEWGVDAEATRERLAALEGRREALVAGEVDFVREFRADAVVLDVPWLAAAIAEEAGVPSIAIANFTWDEIYEPFLGGGAASAPLLGSIRRDYARVTLGLQTPFGGDLRAFPRRRSIPLIARRSERPPEEVRRELGIEPGDVALLCALRGHEVLPAGPRCLNGRRLVTLSFQDDPGAPPEHIPLGEKWQRQFPALVAASDAVLSKPGYGIAGECVANQTPLLHLPRTGFAETKPLLADLERMGKHRPVTAEELKTRDFFGDLQSWLEEWRANPWPASDYGGGVLAAEAVLEAAS